MILTLILMILIIMTIMAIIHGLVQRVGDALAHHIDALAGELARLTYDGDFTKV